MELAHKIFGKKIKLGIATPEMGKKELLENATDIIHYPEYFAQMLTYTGGETGYAHPTSFKLGDVPVLYIVDSWARSQHMTSALLYPLSMHNKLTGAMQKIRDQNETALPWERIVMDQDIKDRFRTSTLDFLFDKDLRALFKKHHMKNKRCLLLYGPPGCGKSSLIAWLRSEMTRRNVAILTWDTVLDSNFNFSNNTFDSLYILEDIDTAMSQRDNTIYSRKDPIFSRVLTLLDGAERLNNYVVVMTANNPNILDKALLRDGRSDEKLFIGYPTREQKEQYLKLWIKPLVEEVLKHKFKLEDFNKFLDKEDVPFATLDNVRKKVFIYKSVAKAVKTTDLKLSSEEKERLVGFNVSSSA